MAAGLITVFDGGGEIPVYGRGVIGIRTVFMQHLPIAIDGMDCCASDDFQFMGRRGAEYIQELGDRTHMIRQCRHIRIKASEHEPAVTLQSGDRFQIEARLIKIILGPADPARLDAGAFAVGVVAPVVIGARNFCHVTGTALGQQGTAVRAGVYKCTELAALAPDDEDRLTPDVSGDIVAWELKKPFEA